MTDTNVNDILNKETMTADEMRFLEEKPEIKVKRMSKKSKNSTSVQMMIESNSNDAYIPYNRKLIVASLIKEIGIAKTKAIAVAKQIEDIIKKSNFTKPITTTYIRTVANQILAENGYDKGLKYSSLSIPIYDVKQATENHNNENSNTGFTPESINLLFAGQIQKQYALREVFESAVGVAHLKGELHCHDLDFVTRPYAFEGETSFVTIRDKVLKQQQEISMDKLHELLINEGNETVVESDAAVTIKSQKYEILDKDNTWTDLISLTKVSHSKDIYEVELENGSKIFVTEEHPCIVIKEGKEIITRTDELQVGDTFYAN